MSYFNLRPRFLINPTPLQGLTLMVALSLLSWTALAVTINRVSLANDGTQIVSGFSEAGGISADGQTIVFDSTGDAVVANDTNAAIDVFVRDLGKQTTERVSVDSVGNQGNAESKGGVVSANGLVVAFWSNASNLTANDTNERWDVFVHDRSKKTTLRIRVADPNVSDRLGISGDGRFVVFSSATPNIVVGDTDTVRDIFLYDIKTHVTQRLPRWGGQAEDAFSPTISTDGQHVAYSMNYASRIVKQGQQIVVQNLANHTMQLANDIVSLGWNRSPTLSADGSIVAFFDALLGKIIIHDMGNGHWTEIKTYLGTGYPALSADGSIIVFATPNQLVPQDTNRVSDIYVYNAANGGFLGRANRSLDGKQDKRINCTAHMSLCFGGTLDSAYLSANGRMVAFSTLGGLVNDDTNQAYDGYVRTMTNW